MFDDPTEELVRLRRQTAPPLPEACAVTPGRIGAMNLEPKEEGWAFLYHSKAPHFRNSAR